MKKLMCIAVFMFLIAIPGLIFAEPGIRITQPLDGAIVTSGQEINVSIEPTDGFVTRDGKVIILFNKSIFDKNPVRSFLSLPATFTFKINKDAVGETTILAFATSKSKKTVEDGIKIICQPQATMQALKLNTDKISVDLDWNGNIKSFYPRSIFSVEGIYSDGVARDIKNAGFPITYESSDPLVVSIDNKGEILVHKVGEAKLTISNSGLSVNIPVIFEQPTGLRPQETIPPTIQIDIQPSANVAGWHNSDITITLAAQDNEGGSGIREIFYEFPYISAESNDVANTQGVIPFSKEGVNLMRYGATDKEGNDTGQLTLDIKLDKTPPAITSAISPQPNQAGWHNSDVTVSFSATDILSGVKSITSPVTVSTEGAKKTITGEALDIADNKATTDIILNIDKTPPQLILQLKPLNLSENHRKDKDKKSKDKEEDEGNWYKFIYSAKDNLSGLKDTQAGLTIINLSGFKQELEVDNELEIEIDEKKKEIKIEAPDPQSVLEELKDSLFNIANNQNLQLKIKQGEPKWKLKQKTQGFEIQAPSIIFKAIASDIADNTAIKELEFKKEKKKDKD